MGDGAPRAAERGGSAAKRCLECGVELRAGVKYCDFCGRRVVDESPAPVEQPRAKPGGAGPALKALAAGCVAVGVLVYAGARFGRDEPASAPARAVPDGRRQAVASCEAAIRERVRAPFRVIAFRSSLVAEEQLGFVVSGSVELQSAAGELERKRYFCRVRPGANAGMITDEGRLY